MRRRALPLALSALAVLGPAAVPCASATPIEYQFQDASVTLSAVTYSVTGTFDFDAATDEQSNVSILLSGAGSYAGTYSATGPLSDAAAPYLIESLSSTLGLQMETYFGSDFSFAGSPESLEVAAFYENSSGIVYPPPVDVACGEPLACAGSSSAAAGTANPVPEPSSGALFGTATGLFLFSRLTMWRRLKSRVAAIYAGMSRTTSVNLPVLIS